MKINQQFVELANARRQELQQQVEMLSIIDMFEDMGNSGADKVRKEHIKFLSNKFGKKIETTEDAVVQMTELDNLLKEFVQLDYLSSKFSKLSSKPDEVTKAFETIKNDNKDRIVKALEIDESEVE